MRVVALCQVLVVQCRLHQCKDSVAVATCQSAVLQQHQRLQQRLDLWCVCGELLVASSSTCVAERHTEPIAAHFNAARAANTLLRLAADACCLLLLYYVLSASR